MSRFAAEWLALRERYDRRARNGEVREAVARMFGGHASVAVVDLACGVGSTVRALCDCLPQHQLWRLVDNDLSLLARVRDSVPPGVAATAVPLDLAHDLQPAIEPPVDLVTASAFLDLVSAEWIEQLAVETGARGLPVYAALTYDGRVRIEPPDHLDAPILAEFHGHQRTDKGFGPALGPAAAAVAIARFERIGYAVVRGPADWLLEPQDAAVQNELVSGWAAAAEEMAALPVSEITAWARRRKLLIGAGRSSMRVGHIDFVACPIGRRWAERSQSNSTSSARG